MKEDISIKHPIEHGVIVDMEEMIRVWEHAIKDELKLDPKEHYVLLTEPPANPKHIREEMCKVRGRLGGTRRPPAAGDLSRRDEHVCSALTAGPLRALRRPRRLHVQPGRPIAVRIGPDHGGGDRLG